MIGPVHMIHLLLKCVLFLKTCESVIATKKNFCERFILLRNNTVPINIFNLL